MNEVWFSHLSDPEEFPEVKIVPCSYLNEFESYYINFEEWDTSRWDGVSSTLGLEKMQEAFNQMADDMIVFGTCFVKLECSNPGANATIQLNICNHKWKHYQGFSEEYDYCEACDAKRT